MKNKLGNYCGDLTADGEFEIEINGNEVPVKNWELRIPNPEGEEDPYTIYPHCPYDSGVRLIKVKGSLYKCPKCGLHLAWGLVI